MEATFDMHCFGVHLDEGEVCVNKVPAHSYCAPQRQLGFPWCVRPQLDILKTLLHSSSSSPSAKVLESWWREKPLPRSR